jgi:hypothetical protein
MSDAESYTRWFAALTGHPHGPRPWQATLAEDEFECHIYPSMR